MRWLIESHWIFDKLRHFMLTYSKNIDAVFFFIEANESMIFIWLEKIIPTRSIAKTRLFAGVTHTLFNFPNHLKRLDLHVIKIWFVTLCISEQRRKKNSHKRTIPLPMLTKQIREKNVSSRKGKWKIEMKHIEKG